MMAGRTLGVYFARQYALWFAAFLGGLAGIIFLFEIAELLRRAADRPDATLGIILLMGLYKLPNTIEQVLPFVVLFAGVFTFWRLTRSQELIIARAAGISAWQFLAPALMVTAGFSLLNIAILNPLGASLNGRYTQLESQYLHRVPTIELTGAGLWLRQRDGDYHYLLHADRVSTNPLTLSPLTAFVYDNADKYLGRIDAPSAILKSGNWVIGNAWLNWDQQEPKLVETYNLPTTLTLGKIQESMAPPNTISFWELPAFIRALRAIGLPPAKHEIAFQSLLAQPVMLCAMVFFAAAFSLRMNRRGSITSIIVGGVVLGIALYSLNNVITALGVNQTFPPVAASWAIPLLAMAISNAALLYLEDG